MNILLTSAGRRVSLVRDFKTELKKVFPSSFVYATDMKPELSSACRASDKYFAVPRVTDKTYIQKLLDICLENSIRMVVPTIDTELLTLADNKQLFASNGIEVIVSDREFIQTCRDKRLTHKFFDEAGINRAKEIDNDNPDFPIFVKPYNGSCSQDIYIVEDENMLQSKNFTNSKFMFLEYFDPADHTEFTIDMYFDKNSKLKCVVPRERIEIRSGEVNKGVTRKNVLVKTINEKFAYIKGAVGCITLQVFVNIYNKQLIGIEINPRFGGGYPLSYLAGANFPGWLIKEYFLNEEIDYYVNWEDNLLMLRYDDEIIIKNYI